MITSDRRPVRIGIVREDRIVDDWNPAGLGWAVRVSLFHPIRVWAVSTEVASAIFMLDLLYGERGYETEGKDR